MLEVVRLESTERVYEGVQVDLVERLVRLSSESSEYISIEENQLAEEEFCDARDAVER